MLLPEIFVAQKISAYIDLGTGSFVIQILIAGIIGGFFMLKIFWGRVKAFFWNLFSKTRSSDE